MTQIQKMREAVHAVELILESYRKGDCTRQDAKTKLEVMQLTLDGLGIPLATPERLLSEVDYEQAIANGEVLPHDYDDDKEDEH